MDETAFWDKYWHSNTKIVTVVNPRTEDYIFQAMSETGIDTATGKMRAEQRTYRVPQGGQERFPGPIANMFLDQMSKLVAQDDDKIQYMIDFALRAQYYDDLTVGIEDLIHTYTPFPEYLEKPAEDAEKKPEEIPFGGATYEPKKLGRPPKAPAEA